MRRAIAELTALFFVVGACAFRDWINMAAAAVMALLALVEVLRERNTGAATVTPTWPLPRPTGRVAEPLSDEAKAGWPWAK